MNGWNKSFDPAAALLDSSFFVLFGNANFSVLFIFQLSIAPRNALSESCSWENKNFHRPSLSFDRK